jgi:hypothetical protein
MTQTFYKYCICKEFRIVSIQIMADFSTKSGSWCYVHGICTKCDRVIKEDFNSISDDLHKIVSMHRFGVSRRIHTNAGLLEFQELSYKLWGRAAVTKKHYKNFLKNLLKKTIKKIGNTGMTFEDYRIKDKTPINKEPYLLTITL